MNDTPHIRMLCWRCRKEYVPDGKKVCDACQAEENCARTTISWPETPDMFACSNFTETPDPKPKNNPQRPFYLDVPKRKKR